MKKKQVIFGVAIAFIACGIGVYASGLGSAVVSKFTGEQKEVVNKYAESLNIEDTERESLINEALSNAGVEFEPQENTVEHIFGDENVLDIDFSKFNKLITAMDVTISEPTDFNDLLLRYEYLREVHKLSQQQMNYIADLIINGCDMNDIVNIAYFWLDTNEDISLIKEIYDLKGEYEGSRFWIENAYDRVTASKNGTLSTDDIENYFSRGMTAEDITTADKLCRKGVYTIQEILDKRCEGQSFLQIMNEVENNELNAVETLSDNFVSENVEFDVSDSKELLKSKEIAQLTGKDESEVISLIMDGEYNEDTYYEVYNNKMIEIRDRLETAGFIKSETEVE